MLENKNHLNHDKNVEIQKPFVHEWMPNDKTKVQKWSSIATQSTRAILYKKACIRSRVCDQL